MKNKTLHNVFARLAESFVESPSGTVLSEKVSTSSRAESTLPADGSAQVSGAVFGARVNSSLAGNKQSSAGKFQVMRLDRISEAFGDRWPAIQARVMQVAERVLQKRLTRVDCFSRADDMSFLVLFVELTEDQARFKANSIAEEIQAILLGEVEDGPEVGVRAAVADVERLALAQPVTSEGISLALEREMVDESDAPIALSTLTGAVDISYRPTLNVQAGYIAIFDTAPSRQVGTRCYRGNSFFPGGSGELNLRMNLQVICRTMVAVQEATAAGHKFGTVLPIHFHAIGSRFRHELIEVLRTIDMETRRLLILDIIGCTPGTPSVRLGEVVSALAPFGRAVTLRLDMDYPHINALTNLGLTAIGTDLGERDIDGVAINQLIAFVRRVRTINLRPYVFGVRSADMITPLAELGVSYINGPAVAASTPAIGTLTEFGKMPAARPIMELVPALGATLLKTMVPRSAAE